MPDSEGNVQGYAPTPVRTVGKLSLPNVETGANGAAAPFTAPPGGLLVVYFGFVSCPDVCPVSMGDLAAGLKEMGPAADKVEVAFVSVDIERDTPEMLNKYLSYYFGEGNYRALRANDAYQLNGVTYEFGAQWNVEAHEPGDRTYVVSHTGVTFVVNDKGQLVWAYPWGTSGPDIAATLNELLAKQQS